MGRGTRELLPHAGTLLGAWASSPFGVPSFLHGMGHFNTDTRRKVPFSRSNEGSPEERAVSSELSHENCSGLEQARVEIEGKKEAGQWTSGWSQGLPKEQCGSPGWESRVDSNRFLRMGSDPKAFLDLATIQSGTKHIVGAQNKAKLWREVKSMDS